MELCLRIVLLLSTVAITAVVGNSTGAPEAACDSVTPAGHGATTATDPVPFIVNISSLDSGYVPGETYTIVLSGSSQNADFAGFLIQGRMAADGTTRVGTFVDNGDDQQTACSDDSSATHTGSAQKTAVQLMWTAPPMGTGAILFRYAFVESFSVFWPNQVTGEVSEVVAAAATTTTASTSSIASSPTPTTDVTTAPTTTIDAPTMISAPVDIVTSSVVMSSALPTDDTTTTSSIDVMMTATPTVGATPAAGATGVMATSSVLILLLASVIILIM